MIVVSKKNEGHLRKLEKMYERPAVNQLYRPTLKVEDARSEITMPVLSDFFHSAGAIHGSVYFKILDDAACFAAWSREPEFFVVTASFTTYIVRPVSEGSLHAVGEIINESRNQFIVEAKAYDDANRLVAHGNGIMMRGRDKLSELDHYAY